MPELPEVETVRRGLNQLTLNQKITGGDVLLDRTIAYPFSVGEFIDGIKNNAIAIWHRRGKYLLAEFTPSSPSSAPHSHSSTSWLGVHLRMTGQLLWVHGDEPLHKHTRVRLFFGDRQELRFVDQRTFGQMWWVPPGVPVESVITGLAKLAADPFSPEFTVEYLAGKLQKRRRPIKTALLDQSVVAGLGNIYADEALFKSGILPETLCTDLQLKQIEDLRTAIIQVLETSIEAGGTTFSNFLNVKGVNGNYGGVAWVYNRAGEPCRVCGTPIMRIRLAGRSSHFCPQCQRM
ncbi:DNA-formamidopyrimidine glycosylase [Nostoc sp. FACHB-973]|uniref:Formamidopyrimidine-DNA glycosylase n=1 Tax=Desmonostoc muscorum LEGE 12446 TaxID=1828758 RepID=A0A8J6ZYF4_DESMC|nr:DNA-formamidopyrimidine glycosylase [Desmonostoc muscorum]MBD2520349.1 DNA-formamidopyrimidine glycosylase [Nostoc sp. FACHB-973]MBX9258907.1 DNA-formamidopyrimidine glycosylase [Desmonostoc muscorum CCALA 125]MCF2148807.1 DNA-formamidopyrimidine glycosylase [Desmonostoc muscorum LEGE 12446]